MDEPAIQIEELSKLYRLGTLGAGNLARSIGRFLPAAARQRRGGERDLLWALRDVSFDVGVGEVVGIIGRNGAGKSTLLKILSRITAPTGGRAVIHGRVASLLEVGTGFHPELTGRENVYMNGAILGMTRAEIDRRFDEIVEFSGVERFLDTPLKRYSSGMQVRLAFAVAAHLDSEIMFVDEVLAVGDIEFQNKCLGKMQDVADSGRTVLFVSHNLGAIRALCSTSVVLHQGEVVAHAAVEAGIDAYLSLAGAGDGTRAEVSWPEGEGPGSEQIRCRRVRLLNENDECVSELRGDERGRIELEYDVLATLRGFRFHLTFVTDKGEIAFRVTDHRVRTQVLEPGRYRTRCLLPSRLFNRHLYTVVLGGGVPNVASHLDGVESVIFRVTDSAHGSLMEERWPGVVAPHVDWEVDRPVSERSRRG